MPKALEIASTVCILITLILAVIFVGFRFIGLEPYIVLSGSMEPEYSTGDLLYVAEIDYKTLKKGDVITFLVDEDIAATHRIVQVVPDKEDETVLRFQTKGDANEFVDAGLVHYKNIIGKPVISIPLLGYIANFIAKPPGLFIAVGICVALVLVAFLPDVIGSNSKKKEKTA